MNSTMNRWIRQTHRWISVAFTVCVVANFVAMGLGHGQQLPAWITYSPLAPLALLWFSGTYLFLLPYLIRPRSAQLAKATSIVDNHA
jgi:hypothetical protein